MMETKRRIDQSHVVPTIPSSLRKQFLVHDKHTNRPRIPARWRQRFTSPKLYHLVNIRLTLYGHLGPPRASFAGSATGGSQDVIVWVQKRLGGVVSRRQGSVKKNPGNLSPSFSLSIGKLKEELPMVARLLWWVDEEGEAMEDWLL